MSYYIKSVLGAAIFIGAVVLFNVKLTELLDVGTCATGSTPYQIARPCPEGTGTDILLLTGSIFAGLLGAGIFALRGSSPRGEGRLSGISSGMLVWGVFFTATGAVALLHALTSAAVTPGGKLGGAIVGATFLLMGLPVLIFILTGVISDLRDPSTPAPGAPPPPRAPAPRLVSAPTSPPAAASAQSGDDTIGKLERLQKLHESGALTPTEFELEKIKLLRGN